VRSFVKRSSLEGKKKSEKKGKRGITLLLHLLSIQNKRFSRNSKRVGTFVGEKTEKEPKKGGGKAIHGGFKKVREKPWS